MLHFARPSADLRRELLARLRPLGDHLEADTLPPHHPAADPLARLYRETAAILDKSVQKGVLHKNTANRYKSRLNARVKAVAAKKAA